MLTAWTVILVALAYVGLLFAIASYGDGLARQSGTPPRRPLIYAMSLAVYCTSWTFFGSVGLASRSGLDFLAIYVGPILVFLLGWRVVIAIAEISKKQNITSIADFIAARYGKNQALGALVAVIAAIGVVPYISLQLKAVSFSLETMLHATNGADSIGWSAAGDLALIVTIAMACFAALFGTRHIDATEHQDGLILAIAVESVVKLLAFLAIGIFATFMLAGGPSEIVARARAAPEISGLFTRGIDGGRFITMTLIASFAILLLPRQFHVSVVENASRSDIRRAAWVFPLYLVAINIFVVPIAVIGLLLMPPGTDGDTFVLALPVHHGDQVAALIAFIGGLSAATAMVIVEAVALSIMLCNNIVVPLLLKHYLSLEALTPNVGRLLLVIRRSAIGLVLALAYIYYKAIGTTAALAQTGLISFAAVAQFAPAFFGGLIWRRATAVGAMAGLASGFVIWTYTLLLPSFAESGLLPRSFIENGPFGITLLRPRMLFNLAFDPLTHGVLWSLAANVAAYVAVSLLTERSPIERAQAAAFVSTEMPAAGSGFRLWRTSITSGILETTVARYLGAERTRRSFEEFARERGQAFDPGQEADIRTLRFAEHLLASAVGAASSRLVLALLIERHSRNPRGALRLLDDASAAIQHNRDLLQSAIDHVRQGIAVFDADLSLICWNRQFGQVLDLPGEIIRVGVPLGELIDHIVPHAERTVQAHAANLERLARSFESWQQTLKGGAQVVEIRSAAMPDGGIVVTFADITERARAAEALERRVVERTFELAQAKAEAEAANLGKTRFIAAASHDILQPLNAARLFTSSLVERHRRTADRDLVGNVDRSLEAVEEILNALLDISRLDAGAMQPEATAFRIGDLLQALAVEFSPAAREKALDLTVVASSATVMGDRRLIRRVIQNLLSNAIKYTGQGRVLVGCRRLEGAVRIEVHDTGPGIHPEEQGRIFREFERLERERGATPGLGLGLSIVERICRMLDLPLSLRSEPGRGSIFAITLPLAAIALPAVAPKRLAGPRGLRLTGETMLVVDNEAAIRDGMSLLLGEWGCRVMTAANAAEALGLLHEAGERVAIVLVDFHLERDDGLALIAKMRQSHGRPLPGILITADRSAVIREQAMAAGVIYLTKPVKPASLRAAIARALTRAEAAE